MVSNQVRLENCSNQPAINQQSTEGQSKFPSTANPQISVISKHISNHNSRTQVRKHVSKSHFWLVPGFIKNSGIWQALARCYSPSPCKAWPKPCCTVMASCWLQSLRTQTNRAEGLIICSNLGGEDELGQQWYKAVWEGCRTAIACGFHRLTMGEVRSEKEGNKGFLLFFSLSSPNDSEHLKGMDGKEKAYWCHLSLLE